MYLLEVSNTSLLTSAIVFLIICLGIYLLSLTRRR